MTLVYGELYLEVFNVLCSYDLFWIKTWFWCGGVIVMPWCWAVMCCDVLCSDVLWCVVFCAPDRTGPGSRLSCAYHLVPAPPSSAGSSSSHGSGPAQYVLTTDRDEVKADVIHDRWREEWVVLSLLYRTLLCFVMRCAEMWCDVMWCDVPMLHAAHHWCSRIWYMYVYS